MTNKKYYAANVVFTKVQVDTIDEYRRSMERELGIALSRSQAIVMAVTRQFKSQLKQVIPDNQSADHIKPEGEK